MGYLTISNLNSYIKANLENDQRLHNIQVIGEISNLKIHHTGHWYLTLKDEKSRINAVMFSAYARRIKIAINDGMKVLLTGDIGVYEQGGTYQLYIHNIEAVGLGNLYLQFEELKKRLNAEGLFAMDKKVSIPKFPQRIAVISAPQGAAIQDVLTTMKRRWPIAEVVLLPTLVQGKDAAQDIVKSLIEADNDNYDVIIMARGGGSIEDLWAFNEEVVAYQIFKMKTPIISAIGHETDYTIADYVADMRAPTPTAAAELATPDMKTVLNNLIILKNRMTVSLYNVINMKKQELLRLSSAKTLNKPELIYSNKVMYLENLGNRLLMTREKYINNVNLRLVNYSNKIMVGMNTLLSEKKNLFSGYIAKIQALSPLNVLERGYALVTDKYGNYVKKGEQLAEKDTVTIRFSDQSVEAVIIKKEM